MGSRLTSRPCCIAVLLTTAVVFHRAVGQDDAPDPEGEAPAVDASSDRGPVDSAPPDGDGAESDSRRPACKACKGKGDLPCQRCGGEKQVDATCRLCLGAGSTTCTRKGCTGGTVTCVVCKGRGSAKKRIMPISGKPYTKTIVCDHCRGGGSVTCWRCEHGDVPCPACESKGKGKIDCSMCGAQGMSRCAACGGDGKGPPPPLGKAALGAFRGASRRVSSLLADVEAKRGLFGKIRSRHEKLCAEVRDLDKELRRVRSEAPRETPREVSRLLTDASASFGRPDDQLEQLTGNYRDLEALASGRDAVVGFVESVRDRLEARLENPREDDSVAPRDEVSAYLSSLGPVELYLEEFVHNVEAVGAEHERLARRASEIRDDVGRYERALGRATKAARRTRDAESARRERRRRIESATRDLARRGRVPEPVRASLDESRDGDTLEIRLTDEGASDDEDDRRKPQPSERLLEALPRYVSALFDLDGEIVAIDLSIVAEELDEFGHPEPIPIQSFVFEREDWGKLRTGAYRSDWEVLLSKSSPHPDFPRSSAAAGDSEPEVRESGGYLGLVGLLLVLAVGVGLGDFVVVRLRSR